MPRCAAGTLAVISRQFKVPFCLLISQKFRAVFVMQYPAYKLVGGCAFKKHGSPLTRPPTWPCEMLALNYPPQQ